MTGDVLFPECWPEINVDNYVTQHAMTFDLVDLSLIPRDQLIAKIRLGGMLQALLENDPLKHESKKRNRLTGYVLVEIRRQLTLLVAEYNRRVTEEHMYIESQTRMFLARHSSKPESKTVRMQPAIIGVRRG